MPDLEGIKTVDPDALFTIAQAARLLGMTTAGLSRRIRRGKMKAGKAAGRYIVKGREIQKQLVMPSDIDDL